nr:RING-H2 finger protein ATL2-like [Tanacetum cinerariifolium]
MSVNDTNVEPTTTQHRWRNQGLEQEQESAKNYALSGKIMLASIIVLFVVVVFLVMLHLYARCNSTCPLCRATVEPVYNCEPDVKILIEPGSSETKDCIEPGSSNVNETVSFGDRRKGVDIRIDVPNRSELRTETGLRIMSPSQGFRLKKYSKKDKIGSKPDKNRKRGEAEKS